MTGVTHADYQWRKSSYSNGSGACVEIADATPGVAVRDSKLGDRSPILTASGPAWRAFLDAVIPAVETAR